MEARLPLRLGRYELHSELASGGMAVVRLGRLVGDAGFSRVVAIKSLHRHYVGDPELRALLLDEARLASRLEHPNLVAPRDLIVHDGELFVVMDYVHGLTLASLVRAAAERRQPIPLGIVSRIVCDISWGLHSAHEARTWDGRPLGLVHRDVSPQNVMLGADGMARVIDFGIAQAAFRSQTTREGHLRAKLAYASPEHVLDKEIDRRADVYATAIVCWELLTLARLFTATNESALLARVLEQSPRPARELRSDVPSAVDSLLLAALAKSPDARPRSAEAFAIELERALPPAGYREVALWVAEWGADRLAALAAQVAAAESPSSSVRTGSDSPPASARASTGLDPLSSGSKLVATSSRPTRLEKRPLGARSRWLRVARGAGAVAVVLALGTIAMRAFLGTPHPSGGEPTRVQASSAFASAVVASTTTASATSPAEPGAAGPPNPDGGGAAEPSSSLAHEAGQAVQGGQPRRLRPSVPARVPAEDCAQLYEIDSNGIRRVKRRCLH